MPVSTDSLTFDQYLETLPLDRREAVSQVWELVRTHMPAGYEECIGPKFLDFRVGEDSYVSLANQKNYISLYLIPVYVDAELRQKLDAALADRSVKSGRACLNFKQAAQLPLQTIGEIITFFSPKAFQERMRYNRAAAR